MQSLSGHPLRGYYPFFGKNDEPDPALPEGAIRYELPDNVIQALFSTFPNQQLLAYGSVNRRLHGIAHKVWEERSKEMEGKPKPAWCPPLDWVLSQGYMSKSTPGGLKAALQHRFKDGQGGFLYLQDKTGTQWRLWQTQHEGNLQVTLESDQAVYGYTFTSILTKKFDAPDDEEATGKPGLLECYCTDLGVYGVGKKKVRKVTLGAAAALNCKLWAVLEHGTVMSAPFTPRHSSLADSETNNYFASAEQKLPGDTSTYNPVLRLVAVVAIAAIGFKLVDRFAPEWLTRVGNVARKILEV